MDTCNISHVRFIIIIVIHFNSGRKAHKQHRQSNDIKTHTNVKETHRRQSILMHVEQKLYLLSTVLHVGYNPFCTTQREVLERTTRDDARSSL